MGQEKEAESVSGARARTLMIMVGGLPESFERFRPMLSAIGKRVVRAGDVGADHTAIARWLNESLPGVRDGSDFVVWVEQRRQWRGEGAPVSISSAQVDDGAGGRRRQPVDFHRGVVRYQMRLSPPDQWYQGEKMRREKDLIAMVTAIR